MKEIDFSQDSRIIFLYIYQRTNLFWLFLYKSQKNVFNSNVPGNSGKSARSAECHFLFFKVPESLVTFIISNVKNLPFIELKVKQIKSNKIK